MNGSGLSLWSNTAEVIESNLLSTMNSEDVKLQEAMFEVSCLMLFYATEEFIVYT